MLFAVVANGIQAVVKTQRQLDTIRAIYPYPKFATCENEAEAREWIRRNSRTFNSMELKRYGDTSVSGYARIEYFITPNAILYNVYTSKVGFLRIEQSEGMLVDGRRDLIKVKVTDVSLDNFLIQHHVIAIRRIILLLGSYVDVDIVVPDISVFLAVTKYTGEDYIIRGLQREISKRLGGVSFTIYE